MNKFLIGARFDPSSLFCSKCRNIKQRYGLHLSSAECLNLPLFAPFEILEKNRNKNDLIEEMEEEVNSFFIDGSESHFINFSSLEIFKTKKKFLLYLQPQFSQDFIYCIESLKGLKGRMIRSIKEKESKTPYLLLGKFYNEFEATKARSEIMSEFTFPFSIQVQGLSLFEQSEKTWKEERSLKEFKSHSYEHVVEQYEDKKKITSCDLT